ncbi:MAG TPA: PilZ domain-containing protein [Gammaproteobacteria bacterium]
MRFHIRHVFDVTIQCMTLYMRVDAPVSRRTLKDLSEGGLCFKSRLPHAEGSTVYIRIPLQKPPFETRGTVTWCRDTGSGYEVGVRFEEKPVDLMLRLVGQACHIKHYMRQERRQGRKLGTDQATREWLMKYGGISSAA